MCFFKAFKIKRLTKKIKVMQNDRVHNQPSMEAIEKELGLYRQLVKIYQSLQGKKKYPFAHEMMLACYRASAKLEDRTSQFLLAKYLLDEAKFRADLENKGLFSDQSNKRHMQQLYEEAHAYLLAAENLEHFEAKRLRGLCYINGWGVPIDKTAGFELVVKSIDQENAWDKVTQIFTSMGLNKSEFFADLMKHRR